MATRRRARREKLIKMSGGKCCKCSSVENLEFDHRIRKDKKFRLSGKDLDRAWTKIIEEHKKCDLLCSVCHIKKSIEHNDYGGGHNSLKDIHGTEANYRAHGCRCEPCKDAASAARRRRGC